MLIAVARESDPAEPRVAGTPETVKKFKSLGAEVVVARGAGLASGILDADYEAAGAKLRGDDVTKDADVVLKVKRPTAEEVKGYKKGALVIAIMDPYGNDAALKQMADAGVMAFAMELMPRITPGAVDGRAVEPGQSGGLSRGDRRRGGIWAGAADDDDGGWHGAGGEGVHHGRRRCRIAGDRDGETAWAPS